MPVRKPRAVDLQDQFSVVALRVLRSGGCKRHQQPDAPAIEQALLLDGTIKAELADMKVNAAEKLHLRQGAELVRGLLTGGLSTAPP